MLPIAISLVSLSSFCLPRKFSLEQSALKYFFSISMYKQAELSQPSLEVGFMHKQGRTPEQRLISIGMCSLINAL